MTDLVEFADFSEKYGEYFLEEGADPIITENSYQSHDMYFEIRSEFVDGSDVYVVDIYLRTMETMRRVFGHGKWHGDYEQLPSMAEKNNAILAITGDNGQNFNHAWNFANGEMLRKGGNTGSRDLCIIYKNGVMETIKGKNIDNTAIKNAADQIWHSFFFGPALLDEEGHALSKYKSNVAKANPRSAIGYFEPGHFCFVQVDGRSTKSALETGKKNSGMTLVQLGNYMESLGCTSAYNLDGGQSSILWFNGEIISTPYKGGRSLGDIIVLVPND